MIIALIAVGLILIPCYELILGLFPSVLVVAENTRTHKELMALVIALALSLLTIYQGKIKKFGNKWLLCFMFFQVVSLPLIFKVPLVVNNIDSTSFWVWKTLFFGLTFLLMLISIASLEVKRKDVEFLFKVMCYVALVQAIYIIFQSFGYDQFFRTKGYEQIGAVKFAERVGSLGQPTLVAPFMAMMIPIALYLKKYLIFSILILSVLLTHSYVAIGAVGISSLFYLTSIRQVNVFLVTIFLILLVMFLCSKINFNEESNGRLGIWKQIVEEIQQGKLSKGEKDYSLTGHGAGSYPYLFPEEFGTTFRQVHNDYLEILFNSGFIGLIIFLLSIYIILKKKIIEMINFVDDRRKLLATLISSFLTMMICAFGTLVLQLGAHLFYTVTILALLHNESILKGEGNV